MWYVLDICDDIPNHRNIWVEKEKQLLISKATEIYSEYYKNEIDFIEKGFISKVLFVLKQNPDFPIYLFPNKIGSIYTLHLYQVNRISEILDVHSIEQNNLHISIKQTPEINSFVQTLFSPRK